MKTIIPLLCTALFSLPAAQAAEQSQQAALRSPSQIIAEAPAADWRRADPDNTLFIDTRAGRVIVELASDMAPRSAANIKALARGHFYDGLSFYRVVDGFVAQAGDKTGNKPMGKAERHVPAEFSMMRRNDKAFTPIPGPDGYAPQTGFLHGFPAARNPDTGETWLVHCPGAFAFGREADINSGGSEFYIVIGGPQRYLDRNTTVFGRVLEGMEVVQKLQRGHQAMGMLENPAANEILSLRVAADLPAKEQQPIEILRTDSASFADLVAARRHRPEDWFVARPDYVDVCSVGVPSRRGDD
ncbi:peptidylprolyl isomerase [Microbulbifer sp. SAOS-129_SWC]|uniref:peptidylprolyl isomerase n=1 Tax=Microbulbifer sp. SAOS-129_SWC TaxID=3145235 RepID=UPI003216EA38